MQSAIRDRYGGPEVVRVEELPTPVPTGDEVLVRVHAASVNRADLDGLYPRWQFTRLFAGLRVPRSRRLGLDVAGVVESVGSDVTAFRPGDRVFADLFNFGSGAFAEYVCAPERAFAEMPAEMSFEDAATLPHSAVLAVQGLRLRNGRTPKAGDSVLINGASGNVGPFAVQVARALGAEVTGSARTEKLDFVRSLGVDRVVDYTTTDFTRGGAHYDWIVDVEARHSTLAARRALRPGGAYVTLGGPTSAIVDGLIVGPVVGRASGRHLGLLTWWKPFDRDDVAAVKQLIAAGKLRPVIDRRFPLSDVVAALRHVDDGRARGKVVVVPAASG